MFTGQGSQYVNMGLDLYKTEAIFREQIDLCSEILKPLLSFDLREILYPGEKNPEQSAHMLAQTGFTQPALFTIEYALAKLWMSWGVVPSALVGHSIGEYVAACLAGVFTLQDALAIVTARGQLMQELPAGSMLAIPLSEKEIQPCLCKELSLAVINAPSLCVVSGEKQAVEALKGELANKNIDCRYLHTSHAFHSAMMEPILCAFTEKVKRIILKTPQIPFVSNVTGTWITSDEATDPNYWASHLRNTVRFSDCLKELLKKSDRVLLEVGPGYTFTVLVNQQSNKTNEQIVLSSIRHPKNATSDSAFILNTLGQMWLAGVEVDWTGFYADESRYRIPLPTYPFERKRYWVESGNKVPCNASTALLISDDEEKQEGTDTAVPERANDNVYEAATKDDIEKLIIKIWQDLLGVDQFGIHDNFFALGGNSLTALRMFSRIEEMSGVKLPLSIFKAPTVEQLAGYILTTSSRG
jgi:acyl transferase domain-containing protein